MKTAIVSCYFKHNYGSMLQAYATQMALDNLNIENETINISGFWSQHRKKQMKYFAKAALTSDILLSKAGMAENVVRKKLPGSKYAQNIKRRDEKFKEFKKEYFNLTEPLPSISALSEYTKDHYSSVLVGSDQLWLPANIAGDYYTLNWVPEVLNTVSYATSFGQSTLPQKSTEKARIFLNRIKHLSVREVSGQKLIKELIGRDAPVVCDPTLLFTGEEWMLIQQKESIINEPYIFVYFLGSNPPHREFVKRLKAETGCKIVALIHLDEYIKGDDNYADETPWNIGPAEFLNLIRNASYICTDSFHCSVFSMLYERNFFSFRRYTRKTTFSTNSRLDTLFTTTGISNRILNGNEMVTECLGRKINYDSVLENIKNFREFSMKYLISSLK